MIIALDTETQGLDATKFIIGCIITDRSKKPYFYTRKEDMWQKLVELADAEHKRQKTITAYAHNMAYDFYAIADLTTPGIHVSSGSPFIASYDTKNGGNITFLSTTDIYKGSLRDLGELIDLPKFDTPEQLLQPTVTGSYDYNAIKLYLQRDTEIVMKTIQYVNRFLNKHNIKIKKVITSGQIAIKYLLTKLAEGSDKPYLFYDQKKRSLIHNKYSKMIRLAYKGGRVEAFKYGLHNHTTMVDVNSLYPYASTQIPFPDLRTEMYTKNPQQDILNKIGVSNVEITNMSDNIRFLAIYQEINGIKRRYNPYPGTTLHSTFTHNELNHALKLGYKIEKIHWSITFDEALENPISNITKKLYEMKKSETNKVHKYFIKTLMNSSYGKLAQNRPHEDVVIDKISNSDSYKMMGYEAYEVHGDVATYHKTNPQPHLTNFYSPIIPAYINAEARIIMDNHLREFHQENLLYMDNDSIIFINGIPDTLSLGDEMGQFKIVHNNEDCFIYGAKSYMIGESIKVSGAFKPSLSKSNFLAGKVQTATMKTIKTTDKPDNAGSFTIIDRDLTEQTANELQAQESLMKIKYIRDMDTFPPESTNGGTNND